MGDPDFQKVDQATKEKSIFGIRDAIQSEREVHLDNAMTKAKQLISSLEIETKIITAIRSGKAEVEIDLATDGEEPLHMEKQFSGEIKWKRVFQNLGQLLGEEGCDLQITTEHRGGCCIASDLVDSSQEMAICHLCKRVQKKYDRDGYIRYCCDNELTQFLPKLYCRNCLKAYKEPTIHNVFTKMKIKY